MFDQYFYLEENSLDLIIKSTSSTSHSIPQPPSYPEHISSYISSYLQDSPLQLQSTFPNHSSDIYHSELIKMKQASLEQQGKIDQFMTKSPTKKLSISLPQKRKASQCTQSSNSPLRKTKHVKKQKN